MVWFLPLGPLGAIVFYLCGIAHISFSCDSFSLSAFFSVRGDRMVTVYGRRCSAHDVVRAQFDTKSACYGAGRERCSRAVVTAALAKSQIGMAGHGRVSSQAGLNYSISIGQSRQNARYLRGLV